MGRKKGRQRGSFATKAQRAAHQTLVRERAAEADGDRRPYRGGGWSSGAPGGHAPSSKSGIRAGSSSSAAGRGGGERPRVTVSVTQLRGILAERRLQDRALEGEMRRFLSQRGTTVRSEAAGRYAALMRLRERGGAAGAGEDGAACGDASTPHHEPGWLLTYDHERDFVPNEFATANRAATGNGEERSAGATAGDPSSFLSTSDSVGQYAGMAKRQPPSLQSMCVSSLAPVLDEYVDSCGADAVRSVLDLMPSHVLADVSALYCSNSIRSGSMDRRGGVEDDMAAVLGCHAQAERLALYAPIEKEVDEEEEEEETDDREGSEDGGSKRNVKFLSDSGILSLIPRLVSVSSRSFSSHLDEYDPGGSVEVRKGGIEYAYDAPDSWEDLDVDHCPAATSARLEGCTNLRRLELCGARRVTARSLSFLLRRCSRITHLSLSGSLDAESGPALLLDPRDGVSCLLSDLKVLDLSHCDWLTDGTLAAFLLHVVPEAGSEALEMVSVSGCPGVTMAAVEELNGQLGGAPYVSTAVQRWRRSCVALREEEEEWEKRRRDERDEPARADIVAVKRWKDKRSRFGCANDGTSTRDDEWREEMSVAVPPISAS